MGNEEGLQAFLECLTERRYQSSPGEGGKKKEREREGGGKRTGEKKAEAE